jgi:transglutaminase-like putative cysteine protease
MKKRNGCSWIFMMLLVTALILLGLAFVNGRLPRLSDALSGIIPLPGQTTTEATTTLPPVPQPLELSRAGTFRYHYSQLSEAQRAAYRDILEQLPSFPESVAVSGLDEDDVRAVFNALLRDQPMLFHISSTNYTIRYVGDRVAAFVPLYRLNRDEYRSRIDEVAALVQSIPLPQNGGEFEIQLAMHDFLIGNCTYTDDPENSEKSTVYGALIEGYASCEGYAMAMLLLLELNGIDAYVVTGYATNSTGFAGGHAWNKVRIEGNWYYLDATWNDPVIGDGRDEIISRAYFNLTAEELSQTHEINDLNHRAVSTAQNYFRVRGLYFDRLDRASEPILAQALSNMLDAGGNMLEIRMSSGEALAQAVDYLFQRQRVYRILTAADPGGRRVRMDSVYYDELANLNIIRIYPVMR